MTDRVELMDEISKENEEALSTPEKDKLESQEAAMSVEVVMGYLASLADTIDNIATKIKTDVNHLVLQVNQAKEEKLQGDTTDDDEE